MQPRISKSGVSILHIAPRFAGALPLIAIALCAFTALLLMAASLAPGYMFVALQLAIIIAWLVAAFAARSLRRLVHQYSLARLVLGLATTILAGSLAVRTVAHVFIFFPFYDVMGPRSIPAYIFTFLMAAAAAWVAVWGFLIAIGAARPMRCLALLSFCLRPRHRTRASPSHARLRFRHLTRAGRWVVLIEVIASLLTILLAIWLHAGTRFGPPPPVPLIVVQVLAAPLLVIIFVPFCLLAARLLGIRLLLLRPLRHAG